MAILAGVDEEGVFTFYGIPDGELARYELKSKPLTDEVRHRLFPGRDTLTSDDAQGLIPLGQSPTADVEGYGYSCCLYYLQDDDGNWVYWDGPC